MRLRQAVFAAAELEPAVGRLRAALGLGEGYADPGVGEFGLRNAVLGIGTDFLEVVAPVRPGTAAGRHLDRRGEGGYMLLIEVDDIAATRARAAAAGVRAAWAVDLPDISATHLHPADLGGTILSVDQPVPPGSWRWGGPAWTGRTGPTAPGRLRGATVEVADPDAVAARWADVLGLAADGRSLALGDGQHVAFAAGDGGLVEVAVEAADGGSGGLQIGAARVRIG